MADDLQNRLAAAREAFIRADARLVSLDEELAKCQAEAVARFGVETLEALQGLGQRLREECQAAETRAAALLAAADSLVQQSGR